MRTQKRQRSWFGQLRRDGRLFAFLCALILVGNLLQPMAAAKAAGADDAWAICATHGVTQAATPDDSGDGPGHPQGCCMAANHCGGLSAPKLLASAEPAFAPPSMMAAAPLHAVRPAAEPGGLPAEPPPAIRAPPFAA